MHYKKVLRYSKFGLLLAVILLFVTNFKHDLNDKIPKIETNENSEISESKNEGSDESLNREVEELTIGEVPIDETPIVETPIEEKLSEEKPLQETPIEEISIEEIQIEDLKSNQTNAMLNYNKKVEVRILFYHVHTLLYNF